MPARKYQGDPASCAVQASLAWRKRHPERYRRTQQAYLDRTSASERSLVTTQWKRANIARSMLHNMRGSAKIRGFECTISLEEMEALVEPMICALTGQPLAYDPNTSRAWWAPSPDKIIPSLGYVSGNVRIVAWIVNRMRGDMTDAQLIETCQAILDWQKTSIVMYET